LAACKHGDRVRVVGKGKNGWWAGLLCPAKDRECGAEWVADSDVFAAWRDNAVNVSPDADDNMPPF
jgi:hypothetical protein